MKLEGYWVGLDVDGLVKYKGLPGMVKEMEVANKVVFWTRNDDPDNARKMIKEQGIETKAVIDGDTIDKFRSISKSFRRKKGSLSQGERKFLNQFGPKSPELLMNNLPIWENNISRIGDYYKDVRIFGHRESLLVESDRCLYMPNSDVYKQQHPMKEMEIKGLNVIFVPEHTVISSQIERRVIEMVEGFSDLLPRVPTLKVDLTHYLRLDDVNRPPMKELIDRINSWTLDELRHEIAREVYRDMNG